VLLAAGTLDPAVFGGLEVVLVDGAAAANAVAVEGGAVIVPGAPRTRALVERLGGRAVEVDTSELRKADGALTCLSILF
jgi:dimethylargininase